MSVPGLMGTQRSAANDVGVIRGSMTTQLLLTSSFRLRIQACVMGCISASFEPNQKMNLESPRS